LKDGLLLRMRDVADNCDHKQVRALTGLRGLLALEVALQHINKNPGNIIGVFAFHNAAVDIFFCLSAFTLCLVYRAGYCRSFNFVHYTVARIARVYPLYAVVLGFVTVTTLAFGINGYSAYSEGAAFADWARQALTINALPVIGTGDFWAPPMWSLSIEVFCYFMIFPILFAATSVLKGASACALTVVILFAVAGDLTIYLLFYDPEINIHRLIAIHVSPSAHWVAIGRGVFMFIAGWASYCLFEFQSGVVSRFSSLFRFLILALALLLILAALKLVDIQWMLLAMPFVIIRVATDKGAAAYFLSSKPIYMLGVVSFSIYLWSVPFQDLAEHFLPNMMGWVRLFVLLPFDIAVAFISFAVIERPARRFLKERAVLLVPLRAPDARTVGAVGESQMLLR
jgi:peptidoglycan/LPS O-acetylase OafA/YrhL